MTATTLRSRELALSLWDYVGKRLGANLTPDDKPDFVVISKALTASRNDHLKAVHDVAMELWQGALRRTLHRLDDEGLAVVGGILCGIAGDAQAPTVTPVVVPGKVRVGDSVAVTLTVGPFKHRLWRAALVAADGTITTRAGDRLAPDGTHAPGNDRELVWHAPPTPEHEELAKAEGQFLDHWVGLQSIRTALADLFTSTKEESEWTFANVCDVFIEREWLAPGDEPVSTEEWAGVMNQVGLMIYELENQNHQTFADATKLIDDMRLAGITVRSKRG